MRRAILAALLLALQASASAASAQSWLFDSAHTLPSTNTGWDAIALEPGGGRLFVARRGDGLLVWDIKAAKGTTIADTRGANGIVLVPSAGRAYTAMTDGSVLTIDTNTLKLLGRTDLGAGNLDGGFWEPTQNRIHMITASGADKTTWVTLDAATGQVLGKTEFNSKTMDIPATDGRGAIFAPLRDKSLLQQLDAKDLSLQKTWKLGDCQQPVAVVWDAESERVLVACRGDKPVFVALNPATGIVATIPIGGGVDGLVVDDKRHLIVTANGLDGSMSVIRQSSPDTYALVETIATRPMARLLQLDAATGRLFTVTASFTRFAPGPDGKSLPLLYHPDSFTILTYRQQ